MDGSVVGSVGGGVGGALTRTGTRTRTRTLTLTLCGCCHCRHRMRRRSGRRRHCCELCPCTRQHSWHLDLPIDNGASCCCRFGLRCDVVRRCGRDAGDDCVKRNATLGRIGGPHVLVGRRLLIVWRLRRVHPICTAAVLGSVKPDQLMGCRDPEHLSIRKEAGFE